MGGEQGCLAAGADRNDAPAAQRRGRGDRGAQAAHKAVAARATCASGWKVPALSRLLIISLAQLPECVVFTVLGSGGALGPCIKWLNVPHNQIQQQREEGVLDLAQVAAQECQGVGLPVCLALLPCCTAALLYCCGAVLLRRCTAGSCLQAAYLARFWYALTSRCRAGRYGAQVLGWVDRRRTLSLSSAGAHSHAAAGQCRGSAVQGFSSAGHE